MSQGSVREFIAGSSTGIDTANDNECSPYVRTSPLSDALTRTAERVHHSSLQTDPVSAGGHGRTAAHALGRACAERRRNAGRGGISLPVPVAIGSKLFTAVTTTSISS